MTETRDFRRVFNRWELKYGVRVDQIDAVVASLSPYMREDEHSDGLRGYTNHSVYYDAPDLCFFWEKIEGLKFRRKLRFRRYGGSDSVFLEIKQRIGRTVQKRRLRWAADRVSETFLRNELEGLDEESRSEPLLAEILLLWRSYDLKPTMATWYRRRALVGVHDPGLRITFDTLCQYSAEALDITEPFRSGGHLLDPRLSVMELKFDEQAPRWISGILAEHGLKTFRISKYCRGVDLARFEGRMT